MGRKPSSGGEGTSEPYTVTRDPSFAARVRQAFQLQPPPPTPQGSVNVALKADSEAFNNQLDTAPFPSNDTIHIMMVMSKDLIRDQVTIESASCVRALVSLNGILI